MANIFHYNDYRKFLGDWCEDERGRSNVFSYRNFSRRAGIKSSGFLKLVIGGKRNLTDDTIEKFARALGFNDEEAAFFRDLVMFNQAESQAEKNHHYVRMMNYGKFARAHRVESESFEYFSKWYYTAIREMVALPSFREDYAWIAKRLDGGVTEEEVAHAITVLIDLGLLMRGDDGKLAMGNNKLFTDDDIRSVQITRYHRTMIRKAEESVSKGRVSDRKVNAITVAMSKDKFNQIKKRVDQFRRELWAMLEDTRDAEDVYQINFQLFSLTKGERDEA